MDVDDDNELYKYDEHASGYEREVVTVDTKIPSSNKGFGMLMKLGWVEGQGLGVSGDGESLVVSLADNLLISYTKRARRPYSIPCEARHDRSRKVRPGRTDDRDYCLTTPRAGF